MSEAKNGDTVKVHYTGKLEDGTVFDTSSDRDPIEFTIGRDEVIPGFEQAVIGMSPGDKVTADVEAQNAYGQRRDDLVVQVERSQLPDDLDPQVGERLQMQQPDGQDVVVTVTDVNDATLTLDANHPLAGRDLTFDIELVDVQ